MDVLLHICCAPCSIMCIDSLRGEGLSLSGFWYNPNIHPVTEYRSRRDTLISYAEQAELPLIIRDEYGLRPFVRAVAGDIDGRCSYCYEERLSKAAMAAAENGCEYFTSSLFISLYQNHELMRETAEKAAKAYGVKFLYRDFRPYFREGQRRAREMGLYMQKYCGCVFSEEDRYMKKPKKRGE